MRLAVLTSHPIQYYAPLFRELARRVDLHVFFAHQPTPQQQSVGFGESFAWDVDLTSGYSHSFLRNVARRPGTDRFGGCDTPEIGAHLRQGRFDAVLILGWHLKSLLQGLAAAKLQGLPVMIRGDSQLDTPRSALKRAAKALVYPRFLRLFDAALCVGTRSREYYFHYGYPRGRLVFSPHCVDAAWFAQRATPDAGAELRARCGVPPTAKVVLFAGKLVEFKRPLDVIEAAAALGDKVGELHVMVAGSGELEDAMRARAQALGVRLHLMGFQNQSAMPAAYAAADLLALPSNGRETWGLVCNEALACGTPIVVSDAAGCAQDLAAGGIAGRAYPMGDIDALTRALAQVLSHPPSAEALGAVSRRHGLEAAADGILKAAELVRKPPR
jgi:glycosyltransferase involved in cell wall biosynthesis